VRVDPLAPSTVVGAWAVDDHGAVFALDRWGEPRFPALPPGRWHVVAVVENGHRARGDDHDGPREILEADVRAGEDLVLDLTER
jgi:hypothetical protein